MTWPSSASRLYTAWLGPGHPDAALALRAMAIGAGITFTTNVGAKVARGVGRTDFEDWLAGMVFAIHLGLSILLIPFHCQSGELIVILAANVIGATFFLWLLATKPGWSRAAAVPFEVGAALLVFDGLSANL